MGLCCCIPDGDKPATFPRVPALGKQYSVASGQLTIAHHLASRLPGSTASLGLCIDQPVGAVPTVLLLTGRCWQGE